MTDNMVERVARAIVWAYEPRTNDDEWAVSEPDMIAARAALEALRKPTEAMSRAGEAEIARVHGCQNAWADPYADSCWDAMLSAALTDEAGQ